MSLWERFWSVWTALGLKSIMVKVARTLPTFYRNERSIDSMITVKIPHARMVAERFVFTDESTTSNLMIDDKFECYLLEDTIRRVKKRGSTAIWEGMYRLQLSRSKRFGDRYGWPKLPELLNVQEFSGIRIHPFNRAGPEPDETDGCLGPGTTRGVNVVHRSQLAFDNLMPKIEAMLREGDLWISIRGGEPHRGVHHVELD